MLPGGLVTFVLTDIEGSTTLFRELGDAYADVLAAHDGILRKAMGSHGGAEIGNEGRFPAPRLRRRRRRHRRLRRGPNGP